MHPAELKVFLFLQKALAGEASMSEEVVDMIASDVKAAMNKQFNAGPRGDFRLRMSNIGKPKCQLWFEKNDPEGKAPYPPHFLINMILGDLVEAVFKGLLRASGVTFEDNDRVTLTLPKGQQISGEYDMVMDGKVDDVKSASKWSYNNKLTSYEALASNDSFGYIAQLVGYAEAAGKDVGGWWVVSKESGEFRYVDAQPDKEEVIQEIQDKVDWLEGDEPFERCFEPVLERYYGKPSGNMKLNAQCKFCNFKEKCWPQLQTLPSKVSKAKDPPLEEYVFLAPEAS